MIKKQKKKLTEEQGLTELALAKLTLSLYIIGGVLSYLVGTCVDFLANIYAFHTKDVYSGSIGSTVVNIFLFLGFLQVISIFMIKKNITPKDVLEDFEASIKEEEEGD